MNGCYMCKLEGEFMTFFFIASKLGFFSTLFSLFSVDWVISSLVNGIILSWHDSFVGKKRKKVWKAALFAFFRQSGKNVIKEALKIRNKMIRS